MIRKKIDSQRKTRVISLRQCVGYRVGSVVSKAIIQKNLGSVTLFSFDRNQGLSEHVAPFDALVCVLEGNADIKISGKSHRVGQGEAIMLPANKPHALEAVTRFKMMLVMIKK